MAADTEAMGSGLGLTVWQFLEHDMETRISNSGAPEGADHGGAGTNEPPRDAAPPKRRMSPGERIGRALFLLAAAFLVFTAGAMTILTGTFPSEILRNSYRAGEAWLAGIEMSKQVFKTNLWHRARTDVRGVAVHVPAQAMAGYTLFTSGDGPYARLVDMQGRAVHEWRKPFSAVWHEGAAVKQPQDDALLYMRKARVLPNGDLLAIYTSAAATPWGYGMVKLDRDSNVIWSYLAHTHHDFDVAPDGRIFVLTHAFTSERIPGFDDLARPRLDDFLVVLSPDGKELKKVSLTRALVRSPYRRHLRAMPAASTGDPLHTNTVNYVSAEKALRFPIAREGQVLTSFRDLGLIAVIDLEAETVAWAVRGPWLGQHDPSILPDGRILLFDNFGAMRAGAPHSSRVIEFDPRTMNTSWSYAGHREKPFFSDLRGSAQRLANGNTLVTEDHGGRIFEITRAGEIVWEYVNPVRGGNRKQLIPILSWGQRIRPESLDPAFRAALERRRAGAQ